MDQGATDSGRGVVARGNKDRKSRKIVDKDNEVFHTLIFGEGAHDVDRQGVPRPRGSEGASGRGSGVIIRCLLTGKAGSHDLMADSLTTREPVPALKQVPETFYAQVGGLVELGNSAPRILGALQIDHKQSLSSWWGSYR